MTSYFYIFVEKYKNWVSKKKKKKKSVHKNLSLFSNSLDWSEKGKQTSLFYFYLFIYLFIYIFALQSHWKKDVFMSVAGRVDPKKMIWLPPSGVIKAVLCFLAGFILTSLLLTMLNVGLHLGLNYTQHRCSGVVTIECAIMSMKHSSSTAWSFFNLWSSPTLG